jgi:magnesium-transporting ATPase (P-type)
MDNEQYKKTFIAMLLHRFCSIFSVTIITISITGIIIARYDMQNAGGLFSLESAMMYGTVLQLAAFSAIAAFFSIILFEEQYFPKLRFFARIFFFMIATLVSASFFVIFFQWFPLNDIIGWLTFAALTIAGFAVSFGLTTLKIKRERKRYGELLADFKARQKQT